MSGAMRTPSSSSQMRDVSPFRTEVLGMEVTVERIDMTDEDQIVAVCVRGKSRQRIPITEVPVPASPPKGWEWIEAYRRWARGK